MTKTTPIHTLVTHIAFHLDEALSIILLCRYGGKIFPGVSDAKLKLWNSGATTPDGRSAEEWERDGYLLIGIGDGRFNEHATKNRPRREGECAATLVAKELGLDSDEALQPILQYVTRNDLEGTGHSFDLAHMMIALHAKFPDDPERVLRWFEDAFDGLYFKDQKFLDAKKEWYREKNG